MMNRALEPMDLIEPLAPLRVSHWFNTPAPITLDALRGRVVVIHAFQMLCPGCVAHGLPQIETLRQTFPVEQVAVIGLHTVFEHHAVMTPEALQAFIHEYRLSFPIGVDQANPQRTLPLTMAAWGLQGTPSLLVLDRQGRLQFQHFGRIGDMALGAVLGQLLARRGPALSALAPAAGDAGGCTDSACGQQP